MYNRSREITIAEIAYRLDELVDVRPEGGKSRNVCLVEKDWFDKLIDFINNKTRCFPGKIPNQKLIDGHFLRKDLVFHKDFEVCEERMMKLLINLFQGGPPITRKLSVNPGTLQPCVILDPIPLQIIFENQKFSKTSSHEWILNDLKPYICSHIKKDPADCNLCSMNYEIVPEQISIGDYVIMHGDRVRVECRIKPQAPSKRSASAMANPTFQQPMTEKPIHRFLTSTLPMPFQIKGPMPVGLVNLGNTCFFNSAMQCLARVTPLYQFVFSDAFEASINKENKLGSHGEIAKAFKEFLCELSRSQSQVNPRGLRNALRMQYTMFSNYSEHDAQELLCAAIDGLHEDTKRANGESPISDIFYGELETQLKCPSCHYVKKIRDRFSCLSLPIGVKPQTLDDCLQSFCKVERLDSANRWECPSCRMRILAARRTEITRVPAVLIIQLKRFTAHGKNCMPVQYGLTLDMGKWSKTGEPMSLVGAVNHFGDLGGGHYTACALDQSSSSWYEFNDSKARKIRPTEAISDSAYLLFYQYG